MVDPSDWRILNQETYLKGVALQWRTYRRYPKNPDWDHDHCSFCREKFIVESYPDVLHEGYCTLDEYHWICGKCFDDFREMFQWRVVRSDEA